MAYEIAISFFWAKEGKRVISLFVLFVLFSFVGFINGACMISIILILLYNICF